MIINTGEMTLAIQESEQVHDVAVCHEVQALDCYRVRHLAALGFRPKLVVDIGGHIGSFAALAAKYFPDAHVVSFEPVQERFALLAKNGALHRFQAEPLAILGFLGQESSQDIYPSNAFERALRAGECTEKAISVAAMLRRLAQHATPIGMLKIDCEEGEVNIFRELHALDVLKTIDVISGEWHFDTAKAEIRRILPLTHHLQLIDEGQWNHFHAVRYDRVSELL